MRPPERAAIGTVKQEGGGGEEKCSINGQCKKRRCRRLKAKEEEDEGRKILRRDGIRSCHHAHSVQRIPTSSGNGRKTTTNEAKAHKHTQTNGRMSRKTSGAEQQQKRLIFLGPLKASCPPPPKTTLHRVSLIAEYIQYVHTKCVPRCVTPSPSYVDM